MRIFNKQPTITTTLLLFGLILTGCKESAYTPRQQELLAQFDQGIGKRGQVFFTHVCSNCHQNQYQIEVPPKGRTMAQWHSYLSNNQHQIGDKIQLLSGFYSLSYREKLAETDQMMELLLDINEEDIYVDLGSYLLNSAKDSDNPQSCN